VYWRAVMYTVFLPARVMASLMRLSVHRAHHRRGIPGREC
jgi:hypothetical protein